MSEKVEKKQSESLNIELFGDYAIVTSPVSPVRNNSTLDIFETGVKSKKTVSIESLLKVFKDQNVGMKTPILPIGTIRYIEKGTNTEIILFSPESKFVATVGDKKFDSVRPNLVMKFILRVNNGTYTISDTRLFAVKENAVLLNDKSKLYALPFPNISDNGWICWGSNGLSGSFTSLMGLPMYIDRLFAAPFNNHLFQGRLFKSLGFDTHVGLFEYLEGKETFPDELYIDVGKNTFGGY